MRIYNMQFANDFLLKFCCGNLLRTLCGRLSLVHTSDIKPGAHQRHNHKHKIDTKTKYDLSSIQNNENSSLFRLLFCSGPMLRLCSYACAYVALYVAGFTAFLCFAFCLSLCLCLCLCRQCVQGLSIRSIRKQSMFSPLGLEDKTTRIVLCFAFCSLLGS